MENKIRKIISLIFSNRHLLHEKCGQNTCNLMSILQLETLRFIKDNKPSMKSVAGYLKIKPPSATSLVNDLVSSGLVKRSHGKNDRRVTNLVITGKGISTVKISLESAMKKMSEKLKNLNEHEQEALISILNKII